MLATLPLAAILPLLPAPSPASAPPPAPPVPFPHPLITEILYAVPTGAAGDANGDGKRDAAGDEFIELVNPHDRPINLRGYRITDRNEPDKGQLRFVFPPLELPPGAVVVVFNGHGARWEGPVGDSRRAPEAGNERFAGARVFTMKGASSLTSWANGGDWALLSDPSGAPVHCVWWGKFGEDLPEGGLVEQVPFCSRGSVTLDPTDGSWVVHADIDDVPFSPGRWGPCPWITPATATVAAGDAQKEGDQQGEAGTGGGASPPAKPAAAPEPPASPEKE